MNVFSYTHISNYLSSLLISKFYIPQYIVIGLIKSIYVVVIVMCKMKTKSLPVVFNCGNLATGRYCDIFRRYNVFFPSDFVLSRGKVSGLGWQGL